jgi:hypothetical protein
MRSPRHVAGDAYAADVADRALRTFAGETSRMPTAMPAAIIDDPP